MSEPLPDGDAGTIRPIRVVIVDDDALVRGGLSMLLGGAAGIEVVGEATDGSEVLAAIDRHRPDVLLLDLRMPKVDGIATLGLLRGQPKPPAVLVLTTFDTDDHLLQALRNGAAGFLVKDTPPADIVRAIELVAAGESVLSPTVTRKLIDRLASDDDGAGARHLAAREQLCELTDRDREIALAVAEGKANAAIAAELHLSVATVKSHVSAVLSKLGLDNRVQIALLVQDAQRS
ncbi:MAG: response regulator transcription factor [Solirubrobacteraceae bacterium]